MAEPTGRIATHLAHRAAEPVGEKVGNLWDGLVNAALPTEVPGIGEIIQLYVSGRITHPTLTRLLALKGIYSGDDGLVTPQLPAATLTNLGNLWNNVVQMARPSPTEDELFSMKWRQIITPDQLKTAITRKGWNIPLWWDKLNELYKEIPGPADLVRFVVRDVWDPVAIAKFGYNEEYPQPAEDWLAKMGLIYDIQSPIHDNAGLGPFNWGRAYWWAHWQLPSPTQAADMLHRLRPTGGVNGGPRDPSGEVFTIDDLAVLLKVQDYPPYWRNKLAAISYRPMGIRMLRQMVAEGQLDEAGVYEYFLDGGYNKRDAAIQAKTVFQGVKTTIHSGVAKQVATKAMQAYRLGVITKQQAMIHAHRAYIVDVAELQAFDAMPLQGQIDAANADYAAQQMVLAEDFDILIEQAKEVKSNVRKCLHSGVFNEQQAQAQLAAWNLDPAMIQIWLDIWQTECHKPGKEMQTHEIQTLTRHGIIDFGDATNRLINLGWSADDANVLLSDTARNIQLDLARQQAQLAHQQQAAARAQQAYLRQLDIERRRTITDLMKHGSPAMMKKWVIDGKLQLGEYTVRMSNLGWPNDDIAREVLEIQDAQKLKAHKLQEQLAVAKPDKVVRASITTLCKWLKDGLITYTDYSIRMANLSVPPGDIVLYARECLKPKPTKPGGTTKPHTGGTAGHGHPPPPPKPPHPGPAVGG